MSADEPSPRQPDGHAGARGGGVMALLDDAMSNAAMSRMASAGEVLPVDIHIAFLQPGAGRLTATARVCGGGRSVCFCEAWVADDGGQVVARAMGTFRLRPVKPGLDR
jgi:uncharacterized protein (TIGR00369 family)